MALFARLAKGLQTLFPTSGATTHAPSELRDEVNLVHDFPARVWQWERIAVESKLVGPALTPSGNLLTAAAEEWIEIVYADLAHDSVTARNVDCRIVDASAQSTRLAKYLGITAAQIWPLFGHGAPATFGNFVFADRPIYLPPGFSFAVTGDTAAAVYTISMQLVTIHHPYPEIPLL